MSRALFLHLLVLALGCITASCARPEPQSSSQRVLLVSRQLQQAPACQDQYSECPTWAQQGICAPGWTVGAVVCPVSCNNCTTNPGVGNGGGNNGTTNGTQPTDSNDWLGWHNYFRSLHGSPALVSDANIVASAQSYANYLASNCQFQHSNSNYGENLAAGDPDWQSAVKAWYDEISLYDYNNPGFSMETGHFTQVVWKSTTNLGCGVATNPSCQYNFYYVCQYNPPGNVEGEYTQNVPPLLQQ